MSDTAKLSLPLLAPSQAQKHVTVNDALVRLDGAVQMTAVSRSVATPPGTVADGAVYLVPTGAVNAWAGQEGRVALGQNGGWVFLDPRAGWRVWVDDEAEALLHDGTGWVLALAVSPGGAGFALRVHEFDHVLAAGASSTTTAEIPANVVVFGVSGRVLSDIGGTMPTWRLGVAGSDNRYGSGLGLLAGSFARGLTGSPLTYYSTTELVLTAEGGSFDGSGSVRLAIHLAQIGLPRLV